MSKAKNSQHSINKKERKGTQNQSIVFEDVYGPRLNSKSIEESRNFQLESETSSKILPKQYNVFSSGANSIFIGNHKGNENSLSKSSVLNPEQHKSQHISKKPNVKVNLTK